LKSLKNNFFHVLRFPKIQRYLHGVKDMLFKKICPRCKRRYPQNFTACLECGSPLIDTEKEAKKAELRKYLPLIGVVLVCGAVIATVLFFVLPIIQYSLSSGQESGTLSKTAGTPDITAVSMKQPASDGKLRITMVKTRDGAQSSNSNKFLFVTTSLQNLRSDLPVHVSASDFTLLDTAGRQYPSYALGDKIAQDIAPLSTESYDLIYEVPSDVEGLKVRYIFPGSNDHGEKTVLFSI
jgi:hypothetical protein